MALDTVFEKVSCSRCGGSGSYSYCQSYGSTCFKCAGRCEVLTKRGAAAAAMFAEALKVPLGSLKVGDRVRVEAWYPAGSIHYWAIVTEIAIDEHSTRSLNAATGEWEEYTTTRITTENAKRGRYSISASPSHLIRVAQPVEFKREKLAEALAFQASLTKTGKPRKRATAEA